MSTATSTTTVHSPERLRRARVGTAVLFMTNGALFANLLPRYPQIKAELGLTNGQFGLAVAAFPFGALAAGVAAGMLIRRFGSARVAVAGSVLVGLGMALVGLSTSGVLLAAALLFAGAMDAVTDVAQNAHGLRVQRQYGRSILNSFHALWSIGAAAGGLLGGAAASLAVPVPVHLAGASVLLAIVALLALRLMLPGRDEQADASTSPSEEAAAVAADGPPTPAPGSTVGRWTWLVLIALSVIAAGNAVVEDAGSSWAALYLSGPLNTSAGVASLGFVALVGAQFVGRILGDRAVDRFGDRAVARAGAGLAAVGMGAALVWPSVPLTIVGFAAAGLGIATLVPAAMHAADELPGLKPGTGLTMLSWLMRIGFLLAPPAIGAMADATSLRAGLGIVPVVGIVVIVLSGTLRSRSGRPTGTLEHGDE